MKEQKGKAEEGKGRNGVKEEEGKKKKGKEGTRCCLGQSAILFSLVHVRGSIFWRK